MTDITSKPPAKWFLRIILIIAGASFLLVLAVLYFSFSSATITLYTAEEPVETSFTSQFPTNEEEADPADLAIVPGRVETVELSDTKEVASVGEKPVPDYAQVDVTIYNQQNGSQSLLPRTQLVNEDGIKFRTDEAVTVPAGGSITVGATADQKGAEYNIEPSTFSIIKLSSELQQLVYAESKEKATGGEKVLAAVSEDDIKNAQESLISELESKAADELRSRVSGTEQYVPSAVTTEILEQDSDTEPGTQTDAFTVNATVKVSTAIFDENNLLQLAIAQLKAALPEDQELVTYDPASFSYEITGVTEKPQVQAALKGIARKRVPPEVFTAANVTGKTRSQISDYFSQYQQIAQTDVQLSPFWSIFSPTFEDRITIQVGESKAVAEQNTIETDSSNEE